MVHVSQKIRMENLETIKQLIAKCMPQGAKNRRLVAMVGTKYGFSRRTTREYLEDLRDAGRIVWDLEKEVWKMPTEEGEQ